MQVFQPGKSPSAVFSQWDLAVINISATKESWAAACSYKSIAIYIPCQYVFGVTWFYFCYLLGYF